MFELLLHGFGSLLHVDVLIALVGGTVIGYLLGAMPGLGPSLGVALLVPFTYGVDPVAAMVGLVALYAAAEYGGAITAILINTPGTAAAVATAWDGYPMACRGEAGFALNVSIVTSGIGALISTALLIFTAVPLSEFALSFGPAEYCALGLFGLSLIGSLSSGSAMRGLFSLFIGLAVALIGLDPVSGVPRFAPMPELFEGIPLVPALLGLYAISEVLYMLEQAVVRRESMPISGIFAVPLRTYRGMTKTITVSSVLGYLIGVIPGAGASIASLVAYNEAKRTAKDPGSFGKGNPEGVAASETANNAAVSGALAPLLALGIPGSATAAVLIGALMIQGIQPGPLLFTKNPEIPYSIFASLLVGIPLMVLVGLCGAKLWVKVANVPAPILAAIITGISLVGAYASQNSMFPVYITLGFGLLGYLLRKADVPLAPIVLALVLAPMVETNYRRAMLTSDGNLSIFLTSPISLVLVLLATLSLGLPAWRAYRQQRREGAVA